MVSDMYESISIDKFRGFREFRLHNLGRVNLLVGTNNCGKTSALEAIELLASKNSVSPIWRATNLRGERIYLNRDPRSGPDRYADISHLFYGHSLETGSYFSISGEKGGYRESVSAEIVNQEESVSAQINLFENEEADSFEFSSKLSLTWLAKEDDTALLFDLTPEGGIQVSARARAGILAGADIPVRYISTEALNSEDVDYLFGEIVLTPEEDTLIGALKAIDPTIERIASIPERKSYYSSKANIRIKCIDHPGRIPIGTMGDGMWRMLGLAIALVTAKNGILLVDEIDTGLHYSVMTDMWKLIQQTSKRLNVQVFATTHSRDCYESLASIACDSEIADKEVSIQRIERDRTESVAYSEQEIIIAAERGLEVR
jgi:AAA ATPase domain